MASYSLVTSIQFLGHNLIYPFSVKMYWYLTFKLIRLHWKILHD